MDAEVSQHVGQGYARAPQRARLAHLENLELFPFRRTFRFVSIRVFRRVALQEPTKDTHRQKRREKPRDREKQTDRQKTDKQRREMRW